MVLPAGSRKFRFASDDEQHEIAARIIIAGCDGTHGVCRSTIPAAALASYDKVYPFAWFGILARRRRHRIN